jgi:hypothetical protein
MTRAPCVRARERNTPVPRSSGASDIPLHRSLQRHREVRSPGEWSENMQSEKRPRVEEGEEERDRVNGRGRGQHRFSTGCSQVQAWPVPAVPQQAHASTVNRVGGRARTNLGGASPSKRPSSGKTCARVACSTRWYSASVHTAASSGLSLPRTPVHRARRGKCMGHTAWVPAQTDRFARMPGKDAWKPGRSPARHRARLTRPEGGPVIVEAVVRVVQQRLGQQQRVPRNGQPQHGLHKPGKHYAWIPVHPGPSG